MSQDLRSEFVTKINRTLVNVGLRTDIPIDPSSQKSRDRRHLVFPCKLSQPLFFRTRSIQSPSEFIVRL